MNRYLFYLDDFLTLQHGFNHLQSFFRASVCVKELKDNTGCGERVKKWKQEVEFEAVPYGKFLAAILHFLFDFLTFETMQNCMFYKFYQPFTALFAFIYTYISLTL